MTPNHHIRRPFLGPLTFTLYTLFEGSILCRPYRAVKTTVSAAIAAGVIGGATNISPVPLTKLI